MDKCSFTLHRRIFTKQKKALLLNENWLCMQIFFDHCYLFTEDRLCKTLTICVFIAWQISNGNMKIKSNWISLVKSLIVVKMIGHHGSMSQVRNGRFMQHCHDAAECWWRENAIFCQRMRRIVDKYIFAVQLGSADKIYFLNRIMCSDFQRSWNHCKIYFTNMSS